jgi:hypothetical protein
VSASTTCRSRDGLAFGHCEGKLVTLTLWSGGTSMRRRLYCAKCGKVASAKSES